MDSIGLDLSRPQRKRELHSKSRNQQKGLPKSASIVWEQPKNRIKDLEVRCQAEDEVLFN
ncbi:hypothetical protein DQG23_38655 [Paenibacillus contaminans]|uniref:Uncharacterized protein n=1 Tax=Paenibacillus contaminans TaxID=450362 RepID=A0A329LQB0_9BACL|nr:hypothetical protein DQG23_38655 [Paenibacillus contaminans]